MSLRDQLLASREAKTVTITPSFLSPNGDGKVPTVELIMLTVAARRDLLKSVKNDAGEDDPAALQAAIAIATARDPKTKQMLFTAADRDALTQWPALELDELTKPAMTLNGLDVQSAEDIAKNSTPTPNS
jgi:hypothetical protein